MKDAHLGDMTNYNQLIQHSGWLVTSLPDENEASRIHFYFNTRTYRLTWKPSYAVSEPTDLDPTLLNREDIEKCIQEVNLARNNLEVEQSRTFSHESFDLLDRLIRAFILRQHYYEWCCSMVAGIQKICANKSLLQGILHFQALWKGFCARRRYKAYLQTLRSPKLKIAAARILRFIRVQRRRRFIERTLCKIRIVLRSIRILQALWRGFSLRQTLKTALLLALNPMSKAAYDISIASVARIFTSNLVPPQIISISQAGFECFQTAQNMEDNAKELIRLDEEVNRSTKLLQLVEQMRRDVAASNLKRPILCLTTIAPCVGTRSLNKLHLSPIDLVTEKYGGLIFLLYAEPDYFARLLTELPPSVLWAEKTEGALDACKPSEFALRLERIILGFYNYGKKGGDELSLTFLIIRALHIYLKSTSWKDVKSMQSHFALRLGVAMTLVSHSKEGNVVERLIPLLQDILVNNTKHQQSESRISSRMPQGDVSPTPFDVSLVFRIFI